LDLRAFTGKSIAPVRVLQRRGTEAFIAKTIIVAG
jgi:hypothetical protein